MSEYLAMLISSYSATFLRYSSRMDCRSEWWDKYTVAQSCLAAGFVSLQPSASGLNDHELPLEMLSGLFDFPLFSDDLLAIVLTAILFLYFGRFDDLH